jgi:hypothetical protein
VMMDRSNPRIAKWLEMYGGEITAEQMSLALGAGDPSTSETQTTFRSLRESIRTNGGLIHPIIANRIDGGTIVVIEGNTRTLIYREFLEQGAAGDWAHIPALVYENLTPAQIDQIRLQAHLVGPREWNPYSKARYLKQLRDAQNLTYNQIVDFCGGREQEVEQYIGGYNDMEKYYRPVLDSDSDFDPSRFSAFAEADRTETPTGKDVRKLRPMLENDDAREDILRRGLDAAPRVLGVPRRRRQRLATNVANDH